MSTAIVLPTLSVWAEGHLSAVLQATTEAEFDSAFDGFVSKHANNITVNGQHLSRDQYKQQLMGESAVNKKSGSVKFNGVVEVSTDLEQPVKAGAVGAFYTATIELNEIVFGAPAQTESNSSINIVIEQDRTLPQPPVFVNQAIQITPPHSGSTA
ncbi:hypothetical protein PILCRDRAFT_397772 [Piloderma croceum F 1598]|uniref:NTF2 domain-containing protein n=1 Tax=Piloderma croceum (strain F 1598) TaxID=765440 RepID=A0A0C3BCS0_PILCF|nr:hypothetical protein PILCRDRAFT_397772 [Piloderma croceum F 1598]